MRLATTAVLGATAVILGVAIHRVDEQPVSGKRAAELANVLVRYDLEAVEEIAIERGTAKTLLERRDGAWYFTEPEQDRVDATLALALLDRLNNLGVVDRLDGDGETPDLQPLGLAGENAIRITLSGHEDEGKGAAFEESLVLGVEAPRTGSLYARREGTSPGVFVVDGNPRPWLENPLAAMRDRRLLGAPVGGVVQLVIRQASGQIALQRRIVPPQQDWALVSPLTSWADREAMDRLLTAIGSLAIDEVVPDASVGDGIPDPLPPDSAVIQAQVYGVERPLTLYLRKTGEAEDGTPLLEARASDRPAVYRIKTGFLAALPQSANDLRDRSLARISPDYLETITIRSTVDPDVSLRAERRGASVAWRLALNSKLVPANQSEVNSLINAVNETAIQRFVSDDATDLAEYGLVPPKRALVFQMKFPGEPAADGTPGPAREFVRVLQLGWKPGEEQQWLYANFQGEPHVYALDPTFLNLIPTHPVKWKSLNVLTFNPMHLVSITREMPEKENLKLDYFYREDRWQAARNGVDVTPSLDIPSTRRLRDRLGSLTAKSWYLSLGNAYEALQKPTAQFKIVTKELDRAVNDAREVTYILTLAPSGTSLYFGQLEEKRIGHDGTSPDVFLLDQETYADLLRPITTSRLQNP